MNIVLDGGRADRIPIALIQDETYLCRATGADVRELQYGDSQKRAELQTRLMRRHPENDVVICWDGTTREPTRDLDRSGDRFYLVDRATGRKEEIPDPTTRSMPEGPKTSEISIENPITSSDEIEDRLGPVLSTREVTDSGCIDVVEILEREFGDTKFVTYRPGELFPPAIEFLGGFERAMETVVSNPELVHDVVVAIAQRKVPYIDASAQFRPDGVLLTAYLEGTDMIAPGAWRDLIMPGHRLMVEAAGRSDQRTLLWFLGGCIELLEDFVMLGVDALVVETSRSAYSCDPVELKSVLGERMCVFGWTPEFAMVSDNRSEIAKVIGAQIRNLAPGGGFAMGTTFLTSHTAPETVDFFCDEVRRVENNLRL